MYMRNRKYDNYALNSFPANYAGQHAPEEPLHEEAAPARNSEPEPPKHEPPKEEKKSFLGSLLGGSSGEKGSLLGGLFGNKDGGLLGAIEMEDIILLAVIFFLLKDNFEDDLIIILAIILLSG